MSFSGKEFCLTDPWISLLHTIHFQKLKKLLQGKLKRRKAVSKEGRREGEKKEKSKEGRKRQVSIRKAGSKE